MAEDKELKTHYTRRDFLATTALAVAGAACGYVESWSSLIQIFHAPMCFTRRAGDFTANICGIFNAEVTRAQYRLNSGSWRKLGQALPRVPLPLFTIELSADELRSGINHLEIMAAANGYKPETKWVQFEYDPSSITLPIRVDWSSPEFEVQDGHWEPLAVDGGWRVRPVPGSENYDRIIVVSGAFAGGRRIETDLIFRYNVSNEQPFGFGILPLWGGRPDDPGVSPRRGWNFSLAWYYSHYQGAGSEFSYKHGDAPPKWVSSYRDLTLSPNIRYFLVVECWQEFDAAGHHQRYRQRLKWWAENEPAPAEWIELADTEGCPIPPREYGVALIAHRSQVEFGPVLIKPIGVVNL
ncbi:MAG: twin-arginine translocation signal domain-containing protein [candidate division KSB1 bacterium]|nr:twin-arginine translocation signal domain-containing protein [candidate division KSB1 bacterium]MDZ7301669.1 twin-arginine translocation signal domain-containing protein [candidate division KSB1 bacterium]